MTALLRFAQDNARWLCAGWLLTFSSSYGQTFLISVFAGEIRTEFGLSHAAWGSIYGTGTLFAAVVMIWAGGLTDRFRVRQIGPLTLVLLSAACLLMAVTPAAWVLLPAVMLLRLAGQSMCSHIATVAMARWFVATRGRALAIASTGFSVGEAILPLSFVLLLSIVSWRWLWVLAALLSLAAIPMLLSLLRQERTPQSVATSNQSTGLFDRHWTRGEVLRHPLFWMLTPLLLGPPAFVTALFFQQVHLTEVKGWSHVQFVALFPVYTLSVISALFLSGIAIDRWGTARLIPVFQIPLMIGFILMGTTSSIAGATLAMVLIGLCSGSSNNVTAAFWAEYFGTRNLGAIRAVAMALMVLGSAIGPALSGTLIDMGVSFDRQMPLAAIWFALASALAGWGVWRVRADLPQRKSYADDARDAGV